jgi:enoyl-CoA hydratase/carnithine racemase
MSQDNVVVSLTDGLLEIRFNRPEKKNALSRAMYERVVQALIGGDIDSTCRVMILTGTGSHFTSGNDIADFQERSAGREERDGSAFLTTLSTLTKPLIGAVNGPAIGVGTTMLAHCDLLVAARSARFTMPFTSLGLVPEAASSLLFPRLFGQQRASAMLLLGESLDAETALAWGFVNQVVDEAALMDTAYAMARRLAALPPAAVRQTKHLIKHGKTDVAGRIAEELAVFRERLSSPEAREAFAAFMEKRKPDFSAFS